MDARTLLNKWALKAKRYRDAHATQGARLHSRSERLATRVEWFSLAGGACGLVSPLVGGGWQQSALGVFAGVLGLAAAAMSNRAKVHRERHDGHRQVSAGFDTLSRRADRALVSESADALDKAMLEVEQRLDELHAQAANLPLPDGAAADAETERETLRPPAFRGGSRALLEPKRKRLSLTHSDHPPSAYDEEGLEPDHREGGEKRR